MAKRTPRPVRAALWALAAAFTAFVAVQGYFAALIVWYRTHPPVETAFMAQRLAELRQRDPQATLRYRFVPYTRISIHLKRAVIAAEDQKFVEHEGFDWAGIEKALDKNRARGRIVAGGSTITQQLAKNLFLTPSKSWWRKGEEALIAAMLEAFLSKRRIYELYLNVIEWGEGVFGAEAAAQRYFRVGAADLSEDEAARLAAMTPSPRRFERNPHSAYLDRRAATIQGWMPSVQVP